MLTYGVILALSFTGLVILPPMAKLYIVGGVFASTALLPGLFIYLLVRNGAAGDLELTDRRERLLPYLIFVVSILSSLYFMNRMMMPYWLLAVLAGTCVALLIAMCVNFFWKISAHEIGAGGLLGGLMGYAEIHHLNFSWPACWGRRGFSSASTRRCRFMPVSRWDSPAPSCRRYGVISICLSNKILKL